MNTKGTIYARPRWAGMSPGIVTTMDGNGFPVYKESKRPMRGSGILSSLGRAAKRSACKLSRSRVLRSKISGLKRRIGAQLKKKVSAAVKRRGQVTRRVNQIKPLSAVKHTIRNELSKEIQNLKQNNSIKGGPSYSSLYGY